MSDSGWQPDCVPMTLLFVNHLSPLFKSHRPSQGLSPGPAGPCAGRVNSSFSSLCRFLYLGCLFLLSWWIPTEVSAPRTLSGPSFCSHSALCRTLSEYLASPVLEVKCPSTPWQGDISVIDCVRLIWLRLARSHHHSVSYQVPYRCHLGLRTSNAFWVPFYR